MSTNTSDPAATKITLSYDEDGDYWIARDETRGVTARAETRELALEELDEAIGSADVDKRDIEIDSDDPFFAAPTFSSGRSDISQNVDEHLAQASYRDDLTSDEEY